MGCWSRKALEALAGRVLPRYFALPGAAGDRVDPWCLGRELLGLRVEYRRLSGDGALLGLTSAGPLWVPVQDRPGAWERLDGRTVLLDASLAPPWGAEGRRNFTLAHEIAHQRRNPSAPPEAAAPLCCRREIGSWEEWRADALAAALLMPEELLRRGMREHGLTGPLRVMHPRLDPETWRRASALAESLGVSRQALALRLRRLGLLRRDYPADPWAVLDITMEEEEECRESM